MRSKRSLVDESGYYFTEMAERTGLEPATPGVTGRYSNQLNYRSELDAPAAIPQAAWWVLQGSNLRPTACKAAALPTELNTRESASRVCY